MRKIKFIVAGLLITLVSCQQPKEKTFERLAEEYTAKCPIILGEGTRIDSMKYNPKTNTNTNFYTLTGTIDNPDSIQKKRADIEISMIAAVKNSIELKEYKDFNTTIEYIYFSETTKKELFRIAIGPDLYK